MKIGHHNLNDKIFHTRDVSYKVNKMPSKEAITLSSLTKILNTW